MSDSVRITGDLTIHGPAVRVTATLTVTSSGGEQQLLAADLAYDPVTGQLVYSPATGQLALNCMGGEPDAPCSCDDATGIVACYQIAGYDSADPGATFDPCAECDNSAATAWEGKFQQVGSACQWQATPSPASIGGKYLETSETVITLITNSPCQWVLTVVCYSAAEGLKTIWSGSKLTGLTPVGTYTYSTGSGCDTDVATITVEECPT